MYEMFAGVERKVAVGADNEFLQIIQDSGTPTRGRYIGGGRDKSAPAACSCPFVYLQTYSKSYVATAPGMRNMYTDTLADILNVRWQYAEVSQSQVGYTSWSLHNG